MKTTKLSAPQLRALRFLAQEGARIEWSQRAVYFLGDEVRTDQRHAWQTLESLRGRGLLTTKYGASKAQWWIATWTITDAGRAALGEERGEA